ncbi:hypothetical protein [Williamsia sp. DF01-3]|uniref:phage fiber-tail adaptor protein n=1 Tax=Williamsia sp. DF01-3 TaxID=2934157 RepID=UPI001FF3A8D1|nr:hypothetical protein [Williamsia sp. DF01-3]MCK0517856.1 hypothetical protein [Williamsia sp. DF01-3]
MPKRYTQDPADVLDYANDWGSENVPADERWLDEGETIASSTWSVSPPGLTTSLPSVVNNDTTSVVWLSGGTVDRSYTVTNRITTTDSRTVERSITVVIRDL